MTESIGRILRLAASAVLLAAPWTIFPGCDNAPEPPPELLEEKPARTDEPPPPPSTQELTQGPFKTIKLDELPLTLSVPESWNIETLGDGSTTLLLGHTPSGRVQINLSHRPRITQEKMDIMLEGARKEMADDPELIRKVDFHDRGQMKILERQVLSQGEMPPDPSDPSAPSGRMMRWTITTFLPAGEEFESYELNFIGLSARQFDSDQAFLRRIIDSLAHEGAAAPVAPRPSVEE